MTDEVAGVEFAGLEFAGLENDRLENDGVEQEQTNWVGHSPSQNPTPLPPIQISGSSPGRGRIIFQTVSVGLMSEAIRCSGNFYKWQVRPAWRRTLQYSFCARITKKCWL